MSYQIIPGSRIISRVLKNTHNHTLCVFVNTLEHRNPTHTAHKEISRCGNDRDDPLPSWICKPNLSVSIRCVLLVGLGVLFCAVEYNTQFYMVTAHSIGKRFGQYSVEEKSRCPQPVNGNSARLCGNGIPLLARYVLVRCAQIAPTPPPFPPRTNCGYPKFLMPMAFLLLFPSLLAWQLL